MPLVALEHGEKSARNFRGRLKLAGEMRVVPRLGGWYKRRQILRLCLTRVSDSPNHPHPIFITQKINLGAVKKNKDIFNLKFKKRPTLMQPLCTIILASLFISQQLQFSTGVSFLLLFCARLLPQKYFG